MIGSVALMLEKSFGMDEYAQRIWNAMRRVFGEGYTTADLRDPAGELKVINTADFGDRVVAALSPPE